MDRERLRASYDLVAEDYAATFFDEFSRKPFDRELLARFLEQHGDGKILDVGCGPGHLARFLKDRGGSVQGVDLSPAMVQVARRLNPGLDFEVGDMRKLPFKDQHFSGLAAFYSLIHIPRDEVPGVLREFLRVLKTGGGGLLAVHGGDGETRSEEFLGHRVNIEAALFSLEELESALRAQDFEIKEATEREPYNFEHQTRRLYLWAVRSDFPMDSGLQVRTAAVEDEQIVFEIQRASALEGFGHIFPRDQYPFPEEAERARWASLVRSAEHSVLVAEQDGRPVGVAVVGEGTLERFFVHPDQWGQGVADKLHDEAIQLARSKGYDVGRLWVLEANARARRFYERHGWRADGRENKSAFPPHPRAVGYSLEL